MSHRLSLLALLLLAAIPASAQHRPSTASGRPGFIENQGQWPEEVLYLTRASGADVWVTADALVFDLFVTEREASDAHHDGEPEAPRRRGHVVRMPFEGGRARRASGRGPRAATHNYVLGDDPSRWASRVPLYDEVVLEDLYDGVDLRLYDDGRHLRYSLAVAPGADASQVRVQLEGAEGVSVTEEGVLRMETALGWMALRGLAASPQDAPPRRQPAERTFVLGTDGMLGYTAEGVGPARAPAVDVRVWATLLGGGDIEFASDAVVVGDGSVIVAGYTGSPNFPTTSGAYDASFNGGSSDAFVARLSADGADLLYATFLGGALGFDRAGAVALGSDGSLTLTGDTQSPDFPTTSGAYDASHNGGRDAFVARLSPDGTALAYATLLGGASNDTGTAVALDSDGGTTVAGYTGSPNFPTTRDAYDGTYNGSVESFAARLSADGGTLLYGTFLGGADADFARTAALSNDGSLIIAGETGSSDFPTTPGAYDETYNGGTDAFVVRLSRNGRTLLYGTFLGGEMSSERVQAIAVDRDGSATVAGSTIGGPDFPTTPGAYDETYNGGNSDAFVARFTPGGNALVYATLLGGSLDEAAQDLAIGGDGRITVAGNTSSPDFPTTPGAYARTLRGGNDVFVARLSRNGNALVYSTYFGGRDNEILRATAIGNDGSITLAGEIDGPSFPTTRGAYDPSFNGGSLDAFVARLSRASLPQGQPLAARPGASQATGDPKDDDGPFFAWTRHVPRARASSHSGQARPPSVAFHPAWPNPSRAKTTFTFDVAERATLQLSVHDAQGREVARLVDGPVDAGQHAVRFDASRLPSGIYLARLTGPHGLTRTQRLTVLH